MEINYSLLDQLKRYFQGELDPTTAQDIAKKLEEDPIYQAHAYVYKISQAGINEHQRQKQLHGLTDFSSVIDVEAIWEQDRQLTQKKRWIIGLLAMLVIAVASILVLRNIPEKAERQVPIATEDSEPEVLFGTEGQEQVRSIVPLKWDATDQLIPIEREQTIIVLHPTQEDQISFKRESDTLHLYTAKLDYDPIQWIIPNEESSSILLRLGAQLFDLPLEQKQGILEVSPLPLKALPK
ncbi:MAG: hypothetical protein KTR30_31350 [Saprospiraceae bacterium]|nr:hypothetical protein [Saprospiraceae bacterium]